MQRRRVGFVFAASRPVTARAVSARATNYGPLAQRTMDRWQREIGPPAWTQRGRPRASNPARASARDTSSLKTISHLRNGLQILKPWPKVVAIGKLDGVLHLLYYKTQSIKTEILKLTYFVHMYNKTKTTSNCDVYQKNSQMQLTNNSKIYYLYNWSCGLMKPFARNRMRFVPLWSLSN